MPTDNRGELDLKGSDAGDASFGSDTDLGFEAGIAGSGLPRALRPPDSGFAMGSTPVHHDTSTLACRSSELRIMH
jgi:hypothetical protein